MGSWRLLVQCMRPPNARAAFIMQQLFPLAEMSEFWDQKEVMSENRYRLRLPYIPNKMVGNKSDAFLPLNLRAVQEVDLDCA